MVLIFDLLRKVKVSILVYTILRADNYRIVSASDLKEFELKLGKTVLYSQGLSQYKIKIFGIGKQFILYLNDSNKICKVQRSYVFPLQQSFFGLTSVKRLFCRKIK